MSTEIKASDILTNATTHISARAERYDKNGDGERSIPKTVSMFNALTGSSLTEEQGWLFMVCLKMVRTQQGALHVDNYEDGSAYMALAGEAAIKNRR